MLTDLAEASRTAQNLRADGRLEEAIALHRQIVASFPASAVALHNLAASLGDAGRWNEAETHLRAAMRQGLDAPATWLVFARTLQALGHLDESERAFAQALRRKPDSVDAHRELAQLRWMRTGDIGAALMPLDEALKQSSIRAALIAVKANALNHAGETGAALRLLRDETRSAPNDAGLQLALAQTAFEHGETAIASAAARRAIELAPQAHAAHSALIKALLLDGDAPQAARAAQAFRDMAPLDQHAIALQALAWRCGGDPRYRDLYDYDAFVHVCEIDTPAGWPSLAAYLADLAGALHEGHRFRTHPFSQSIREGTQLPDFMELPHPAAKAFRTAIDGPIRAVLQKLGHGPDPLRARNTGRYAFQGSWSIRMRGGGRHINHVHPKGWISSACYIEVPAQSAQEPQGWIAFGEPNVCLEPALSAERHVQPKPGRLVLFPSYMWHGTVPYAGDETRLTAAFDIVPA